MNSKTRTIDGVTVTIDMEHGYYSDENGTSTWTFDAIDAEGNAYIVRVEGPWMDQMDETDYDWDTATIEIAE